MATTANEIRTEIMSMDYTDPKAVATALERIADKLCDLEHSQKELTQRLERLRQPRTYGRTV